MSTKKELKEAYKQMKFQIGVFQIRNITNGKIYVEGSTNLHAIWNRNKLQLDIGSHHNTLLQSDWKKFGEENFKYEILAELEQREGDTTTDFKKEVKILEAMYIDELKPFDEHGYNLKKKV